MPCFRRKKLSLFLPQIGEVKVPLCMVDLAQTISEWKDVEGNKEDDQYLGDICFSLRYVPTSGKVNQSLRTEMDEIFPLYSMFWWPVLVSRELAGDWWSHNKEMAKWSPVTTGQPTLKALLPVHFSLSQSERILTRAVLQLQT